MTNPAAVLRVLARAAAAVLLALPAPARAQKTRLEVHPRPGDTLRVVLEHTVTISAAPRTGHAAVPPGTTTVRLLAREIVERSGAPGSEMLAIIDSVTVASTGAQAPALFPDLDRSLQGTRIHLKVTPDGASVVAENAAPLDPDVRALVGETPAVLPANAVGVGDTWVRDLPVPGDGSASAAAAVRATFHVDSLSEAGNLVWISLTGALASPAKSDSAQHKVPESKGSLTGMIVFDRRRGLVIESQAIVNIESAVAMPGGGEPLVVRVRVAQTVKVRR